MGAKFVCGTNQTGKTVIGFDTYKEENVAIPLVEPAYGRKIYSWRDNHVLHLWRKTEQDKENNKHNYNITEKTCGLLSQQQLVRQQGTFCEGW